MSDEGLFEQPDDAPMSEAARRAAAFLDSSGEEGEIPVVDEKPEGAEESVSAILEPEAPAPEETYTIAEPEPESEPEPEISEPVSVASDEDDDEDAELDRFALNPIPDDGITRRWYAIHAHSGQEPTVQRTLIQKAEQEGLAELMPNVLLPMEEVAEYKSGEKKVSQRKCFPGYLLVQLPEHPERNPDLWHLIKETTGVTGFIGSRNEPVPLEDEEVMELIEEIRGERERPRTKINFEVNERIKIIDGAFANFFGNINEINEERGRMKVMIEIFERQTSVEIEFWQAEKL
jgi:transcriptional antiterminator NusG